MRRHAGYAELRQLRCIKEHGRVRGKDDHRVRLLYEETQKTVVQGAVVSPLPVVRLLHQVSEVAWIEQGV
jgi:hypothetical protein